MSNKLLTALLLSTLALLQGCASVISATSSDPIVEDKSERSTGAYIDDEIIETKALVNLDKADPALAQSHLIVTSYNGIVLLAGCPAPDIDCRRSLLVRQNVLIDPFMTDRGPTGPLQPVGDLFGAPIQSQLSFDPLPSLRRDPCAWFLPMPLLGQQVCLSWTIAPLTAIASQLTADG